VVKNDEEAMMNAFSSVDMWMPRPGHSLELLVGGRHQTHSGTTEGPKLSKPEAGESGEKTGELPPAAAELACGGGGGGGGGLVRGTGRASER
jgi:hypothetical protein